MATKRQSKIQWYGETLGADGKAQAPELATDLVNHLEGLNRGELYICDNEKDPAIFIRTNKDTIVGFKLAPDIETLGNTFLRKDKEDVTSFLIRFLAGVVIGNYIKGKSGGKIDADGVGELASLVLRGMLQVGTYLTGVSGAKIDADGGAELASLLLRSGVSSTNFLAGVLGQGFTLKNKADGRSYLEVDELFVRIKAFFTELEIKKLSYVGGNFIFSPAGIVLSKVEETETGYKCYFTNDDGSTATENLFRVDDLCLCQTFNIKPGVHQNVKNKRYWRACTAVGDNWFELSKTDCEASSDVPEAGDSVVVLGNKTDAERQNAIIISVFGEGSPSITQHNGIKTYSLVGTEKTRISPTLNTFTGEFHFSSGESLQDITTGLTQKVDDAIKDLAGNIELVKVIQEQLGGLQNQVDGVIEFHQGNYIPTNNNEPAVNWTTEEIKTSHINDSFMNPQTGGTWRWGKVEGEWGWIEITDTAVKEALQKALEAMGVANSKMKVFDRVPTSEDSYNVGDLWVNATYSNTYSNDLLRCKTAKAKGTPFSIEHWEKASKYTDDTTANVAIEEAARAAQAASDANEIAQEASNRLDSWASDGTISPTEKPALKDELSRIDADKEQITAGYTKYGLGTPSSYNTAYTAYRAQLVILTAATPENITIPSDFRTNQDSYYMQRSNSLNAIASAAKDYAENLVDGLEIGGRNLLKFSGLPNNSILNEIAQGYGNHQISIDSSNNYGNNSSLKVISTGVGVSGSNNVVWSTWEKYTKQTVILSFYGKGSSDNINVTFRNGLQSEENKTVTLTTSWRKYNITLIPKGDWNGIVFWLNQAGTFWIALPKAEFGTKSTAWTPAPEDVQADIDAAQDAADQAKLDASTAKETAENAANAAAEATRELADMANDNKLTPTEKQETKKEWDIIVSEKPKNDASADKFGVSKTAYGTAYNSLSSYITPLLSNLTTTSDIVGTTFRNNFKAYYDARTDLLNAIAAKAKSLADAAQETADEAASSAKAAIVAAQTAQEDADAAKKRLDNWASDSVISPVEKQSLKDEIVRIDADKNEITAGYTRYGLGTPTNYNNAHSAYKASLTALTASSPAEITIPSDFATKQSAYYTQRTSALNAIAAKAKEQVDGVNNDLQGYKTTVESKFDATDSKITASVTETKEYTDSAIGNIQIGGRNLKYDSAELTSYNNLNITSTRNTVVDETILPKCYVQFNINSIVASSTNSGIYLGKFFPRTEGETYTWTAYFKCSSERIFRRIGLEDSGYYEDVTLTTEWKKLSLTFTSKKVSAGTAFVVYSNPTQPNNIQTGDIIYIHSLKIEQGNKATPWTPAPEDVSAEIVSVTDSKLEVAKGEITASVETTINNKINDIEIGGRNYFGFKKGLFRSILNRCTAELDSSINGVVIKTTTTQATNTILARWQNLGLLQAGYYTLSFWIKASQECVLGHIDICDSTPFLGNINITTEYKKIEHTYNVTKYVADGNFNGFIDFESGASLPSGVTIYVKDLKIEQGTKATDWTPAPEDTEKSITDLSARITVTEEGIKNTVTKNEFNELGNIVESHSSSIDVLQEGINLHTEYFNDIGTYQSGDFVINPDKIWLGISSKVKTEIGNIEVGGRNLCINSAVKNFAQNSVGGVFNFSTTEDTSVSSKYVINIKCTASGTGFYSSVYGDAKQGETYTWSFYAKCSVNKTGVVGHEKGGQKQITLTTEWQKFTHTFTANSNTYRAFTWYLNWNVNEVLYIHSFKFEKGTKATDWTPAPEDMASKEEILSSFEMTTNGINLLGKTIELTGKVTFNSLASDAQGKITDAQTAATNAAKAASTAQSTANTARTEKIELSRLGTTIIDGGHIKTELIEVNELFSQNITVSNNATITNLRAKNAVIEGELVGVTGTFLSLRGILQDDELTYGEIKFNKDYGLDFTGSDIRHNTQVTEDLGDGPQTRTARLMGNIGWFKQELSFGSLAYLSFDLSYTTDVFAFVLPNIFGSNIDTSTKKYAQAGQATNCIRLYGTGTYTINICNGLEGQLLMFANHTSTSKYICMTRGSGHWVYEIKAYNYTILYCTDITNEYWISSTRYIVNDLFVLTSLPNS